MQSAGATQTSTSAAITLSNLPSERTTATSAAIAYQLDAADASAVVHCRLDSYAPIPCPNPFELGKARPLQAGTHTVDYYVGTSTAASGSSVPQMSYTWTVEASTDGTGSPSQGGQTNPTSPMTPPPTTTTTPPTTTTTPPTTTTTPPTTTTTPPPTTTVPAAGALALAPTPVPTAISGYSGTWDSNTIDTSGATLQRVADPGGSGRMVNLSRVKQGGASIYGGVRSEQLWLGKSAQALTPGRDFWMAFAVQRKADETFGTTSAYDAHLVFQTHTPQAGDTQPDIALFATGQNGGSMFWRVAYNTSGNVDGNGWMSTEGNPQVQSEPLPPPGVWYRYVLHYRPGYLASHNPVFEVWRAKPGAAYEQIVNYAGFNTYNTSKTGAAASYPRIGLYKWTGSVWTTPTVAWYLTPLYFGTGSNLLDSGKAALNGL